MVRRRHLPPLRAPPLLPWLLLVLLASPIAPSPVGDQLPLPRRSDAGGPASAPASAPVSVSAAAPVSVSAAAARTIRTPHRAPGEAVVPVSFPWPWHQKNRTAGNSTDDGGDNDDDDGGGANACRIHSDCMECAASSWGCHWCAADEACHAIGSYHGCLSGVNCYSNDRCERKEPEPLGGDPLLPFGWAEGAGSTAVFVVLAASAAVLCCATCCLCVACCMRGTYEDYAALTVAGADLLPEEAGGRGGLPTTVNAGRSPSRRTVTIFEDAREQEQEQEQEQEGTEYQRLEEEEEESHRHRHQYQEEEEDDDEEESSNGDESFFTRLTVARTAHTQMLTRRSNTRCIFNTCTACYAATLFVVAALAVTGIAYAPRAPDLNVCSDAVAWKSIVDGMTSLKVQASFQILMSVSNPNRLALDLDMVSGNFQHDGGHVGTFTVPPTTIHASAVTDLLVSVTFTPDKWEAMQLTAEYYKGTLAFVVDLDAAISVPALLGYSYQAHIGGKRVWVNDPMNQERHLCLCKDPRGVDGTGGFVGQGSGLPDFLQQLG